MVELRSGTYKSKKLKLECRALFKDINTLFFWLIGPRSQFRVPGPNARTAAMEITPMVSMAAESTEAHRHRARANKRFAAGALCAARERGGVDVCGLVCVCAFEKHAHLKDVAPLPVEALESLVRPCPLIEFTCSKRDPSHWIQKMGASDVPTRLPILVELEDPCTMRHAP